MPAWRREIFPPYLEGHGEDTPLPEIVQDLFPPSASYDKGLALSDGFIVSLPPARRVTSRASRASNGRIRVRLDRPHAFASAAYRLRDASSSSRALASRISSPLLCVSSVRLSLSCRSLPACRALPSRLAPSRGLPPPRSSAAALSRPWPVPRPAPRRVVLPQRPR